MYSLHSWFIHCCTHTLHTFVDFRCAFVWTSRSDITWRPPGTAGCASESIRRFLCLGTAGPICLSLPRQARTENRQKNCALAAVCDRNVQRAEHAKKIRTEIYHQLISFCQEVLDLFWWCCNWGRSQICHHELWDIPEAKVITAPWKARHGT